MSKDSFILYKKKKSLFDKLPDAQAGQLVKAIFKYQDDGSRPSDAMLDLLLEDFIVDFDKDGEKYASFCESRRKAANHRWNKENGATKVEKTALKQTATSILPQNVTLFGDTPPASVVKAKATKIFVPPTVEEIRAYCESRHNGIDAQYFYDYNTARAWVYKGNVRMKDWKAAIRTWERNGGYSSVSHPPTSTQPSENQKTDIFTIMKGISNGSYK